MTDAQAAQLAKARELRTKSPTVGWYLRLGWRSYAVIVGALGTIAAVLWWSDFRLAASAVAGALIAALLRDIRWYRQFADGWPLSNAITDWERVDVLLAEHARGKAAGQARGGVQDGG